MSWRRAEKPTGNEPDQANSRHRRASNQGGHNLFLKVEPNRMEAVSYDQGAHHASVTFQKSQNSIGVLFSKLAVCLNVLNAGV